MSRTLVSGLIVIAFLVGCAAASTVVPIAVADPGAVTGQYSECTGVSMWTEQGKSLNKGGSPSEHSGIQGSHLAT